MIKSIVGTYDITIIGGGIVGLAAARQLLLRQPKLKVCVLEKESELGSHQTKRNSGVVHRGIYYKKKTLKSKFCIEGAKLVERYCHDKNLPYKEIGKLVLATKEADIKHLHDLYENASTNQIEGIRLVNKSEIDQIQPGCNKAIEGLWSPKTAIVDWQMVAKSFANDFKTMGGEIKLDYLVQKVIPTSRGTVLEDIISNRRIQTRAVINCAGLYSDCFTFITGNGIYPSVVPFKGRYFELSDRVKGSIKTNIYPVPDPSMPFLGVHITPRVDGSVMIGPTALLSLGYERYYDSTLPSLIELYRIFILSGFFKMIMRKNNFKAGFKEVMKYCFVNYFANEVAQLYPDIKEEDLIDNQFCGIRAQTMTKDGFLIDDFLFEFGIKPEYKRFLHVRNCPSPAATSSMAIAERICSTAEERLI